MKPAPKPNVLKRRLHLAVVAMASLQFGCGPKLGDVLKKYEPDFRKKRAEFQEIARSLPPTGSLRDEQPCPGLTPPLLFDEIAGQYNTEILMFEQLEDPDSKPVFDLLFFQGGLIRAMQWTGPKSPLSTSATVRGAEMEKELKAALAFRYLVVNRVSKLVEPIAKDDQIFSEGLARIEVFVIDLPSKAVLGSFVLRAFTANHVEFKYGSGESKKEPLVKSARFTMWEDARRKMIAGVKRIANAEIKTHRP